MLVKIQDVLRMAESGNYCIPAFNVYNTETVMGVAQAAEEARAPVIMQVYPRLFNEEIGAYLSPAIVAAARKASVPVCFHLDHGPSEREVTIALRRGATGIMIDGSSRPYGENVAVTRRVVETCKALDIGVEGELGHVGSVNDETMEEFTDPEEAGKFVRATGVDCLAVLIGNAHGHYKKPPKLDIDRVKAIRRETGVPLVLHGGSGIPDDQVRAAIESGVRKMNIGTDVCYAFINGTRGALDDMKSYAVDVLMKPAVASVKALALEKIRLTGAAGRV